ncbi:MAG: GH92 family glycosyl hydrolase [Phycisphaerae bacterium]
MLKLGKHIITAVLLSTVALGVAADKQVAAKRLTEFVNPFIGAQRGNGSTYPGAQAPFGMVSFSPHTEERNHGSGYDYRCDKIRGFGLVHLSGVGCDATCEIPFMPATGALDASPAMDKNAYSSKYSHDNESASPGFYSVNLDDCPVSVRLTAAQRSAVAMFSFSGEDAAHILFTPTASANGLRDGQISIDPEKNELSGWVLGGGFCGQDRSDYRIYYYAQFDKQFEGCGVWKGEKKKAGDVEAAGKDIAAYFTFNAGADVAMKVGISFVSLENAKENLAEEIGNSGFRAVRRKTAGEWESTLSKATVEASNDDKTIFYTALYHTVLTPNIFEDVNGEYMGMDEKVYKAEKGHHMFATFSGWDTYRTQAQLWALLYPEAASDMCTTFLETSRQSRHNGGGGLPLWSMFNDETLIMSGYPAVPFIASAYAFGARDFDVSALKDVMVDSARESRYWGRNLNMTWSHLADYKQYGYYPDDCGIHCSVSQTIEYSLADFSIAMMCEALGDEANYKYFLERSQSPFNLLHPEEKWLWARMKDGGWKQSFDPKTGDSCQEGTSTHYTWGIAHNLGRLINEIGREAALERLDSLMSEVAMGYDYGNPHYLAGNEPCFGVVPVYNWAGNPWKTQQHMRRVVDKSFSNSVTGIPGDDDSGAMSAWYIFAALGLYPEIPGVGGFAVTGPMFEKAILKLAGGKALIITAENAGSGAPYISEMKLNGRRSEKTWLSLDELTTATRNRLDFTMSPEPQKDWGAGFVPPSYGAKN